MDRIAVLIPCYNEALTIEKVVGDFRAALPADAKIYVYDNNSTDGTAEIAAGAGAIVRHEYCQGKGNVIRRMFREIDAQCYIMVDGDDTYDAGSSAEMARLILEKQCDMVVGDRLSSTYFSENKRRFHGLGNILVRNSINALFRSDIRDIMTGYRAFNYAFVKTFPVSSRGFEIETEMSIHAVEKNLNVGNVVVGYRDRPAGSASKLNTYMDGLRILRTIWRLFRVHKPIRFYSIVSALLLLLSTGFFIPVAIDYMRTGLVERFPTLITCGFVAIAAIQAFFAGMILENIEQKNRRDFEITLIRAQDRYNQLMASDGGETAPRKHES